MAKVTSKLQVTLPKAIARQYGIRPGDEIEWVAAGDVIHVIPAGRSAPAADLALRLKLFDAATARQRRREAGRRPTRPPRDRGWTRQELYARARPR